MITTEVMQQTDDILKEIETAYWDIPFENSKFQNKMFVAQAQQTPARAFRSIGLRMFSKIQAIKELKYTRMLEDIDIEEHRLALTDPTVSEFDKRRAQIKIDKILDSRGYADKLLNDAISELNYLYNEFKKYPKYTRETFEAEERSHFEKKLQLQIESHGNGAIESLINMDTTRSEAFQLEMKSVINKLENTHD